MGEERNPPDGGFRALTVVFSSFLCNGLIFGLVNTYSVLYVEFLDNFQKSGVTNASSKASLIGSLTIATTFLLSMVSGMLSDRIGIRKTTFIGGAIASCSILVSSFFIRNAEVLILTYGVLFGIGASLAYVPSLTIVGHYFKKHIGVANGFVTVGSSVFSIAMPYVLSYLLKTVGLQQCLRYMATLLSALMLCALVFKPIKNSSTSLKLRKNTLYVSDDVDEQRSNAKSAFITRFVNLDLWKNERYTIWVRAIPLALCGYFVPYVHLVQFIKNQFPGENDHFPVTCIAITSGIGRILFGTLSDHSRVNPIFLQQLSFLIIGIVSILIPLTTNYVVLVLFVLILGLFDGCFITVIGPIAFQFCGSQGASQAIGFLLGFSAFPLIIGPTVAGWLYDQIHSYTIPFILAGVPPLCGALLLTKIHFIKSKQVVDRLVGSEHSPADI